MILVSKQRYVDSETAKLRAISLRRKLNCCTDVSYDVVVHRNVVEIYRKGNLHYE